VESQRWRGFIQELHIARVLGLLTFKVQGQDRARGRIFVQPLPDPAVDDGRPLSSLVLKEIGAAITEQYAPDEVAEFLREEGIPPPETFSAGRLRPMGTRM
jgi:hypothetical protein